MNESYKEGVENGRLCRKYSNQRISAPTLADWEGAHADAFAELDRDEFVRGCEYGWRHASGASKVGSSSANASAAEYLIVGPNWGGEDHIVIRALDQMAIGYSALHGSNTAGRCYADGFGSLRPATAEELARAIPARTQAERYDSIFTAAEERARDE